VTPSGSKTVKKTRYIFILCKSKGSLQLRISVFKTCYKNVTPTGFINIFRHLLLQKYRPYGALLYCNTNTHYSSASLISQLCEVCNFAFLFFKTRYKNVTPTGFINIFRHLLLQKYRPYGALLYCNTNTHYSPASLISQLCEVCNFAFLFFKTRYKNVTPTGFLNIFRYLLLQKYRPYGALLCSTVICNENFHILNVLATTRCFWVCHRQTHKRKRGGEIILYY